MQATKYLTVVLTMALSGAAPGQATAPDARARQTTQQVKNGEAWQRADDLLRKMTIEEKAMQLSSVFPMTLFDTGVTLPAQQLIGFARLDLGPGASRTVAFVAPMSLLAYTGISGDLIMEPGPVEVSAGGSSNDIRSRAPFTVTGKMRSIRAEDRAFLAIATVGSAGTRGN